MNDDEQAQALPREVIEAIIAATKPRMTLSPEQVEIVGDWLSDEWERAKRRAVTKSLTKKDVDKFDKAYRRFLAAIEGLRDRTIPPPHIPESDGQTAWDDWRDTYEQFGYNRGRNDSRDWILIGALLAIYETVSDEKSSGANKGNPTLRFLNFALSELARTSFEKTPICFKCPDNEALKDNLPGMVRVAKGVAKRKLAKLLPFGG